MKKPLNPWQRPGYSFQVPGFPPGFVPQPIERKVGYSKASTEARQRNKDRMNERVKNAGDGIHSAKWREK